MRFARLAVTLVLPVALAAPAAAQRPPLERIRLPPGFEISVFADNVPNARSMALGRGDVLFVGTRSAGKVYALRYREGRATQVLTLASGLNMPNGVAFRDGALYVAEVSRILRFDDIEARLEHPPAPVVVSDRFPADTHHGWKFIRFGPDGMAVRAGRRAVQHLRTGPRALRAHFPDPTRRQRLRSLRARRAQYGRLRLAPGNEGTVVHRQRPRLAGRRSAIGRTEPRAARGHALRLPVLPPGRHARSANSAAAAPAPNSPPPVVKLGAHVAALGMRFYTGNQFPAEYRHSIFIAEHGSWNRSKKIGYRIVRVVVSGGKAVKHEVFAEGWLQGESAWGRPVDVEVMRDGSLLVSDDHAGAIYRISYRGK